MLWNYLHHRVREAHESSIPGNSFSILLPDQFCNLTWKEFMTLRLEGSNQNTSSVYSTGYRGQTKHDSWSESNKNAHQLLAFKKSIKRGVSQYTILRMRSILRLSKEIFWSQQQHMAGKKSWKEITCLDMMMVVRNNLIKNNFSCTMSSTKSYKVTWAKP